MRFTPQPNPDESANFAWALSGLLVGNVWAGTAGVPIYFNGRLVGTTDSNGEAIIAIAPGSYEVCFGDNPQECVDDPVVVYPDSVVYVTETDQTGKFTTSVEMAEDYIVQDPDKANKNLICHKDKFTISVGIPAKNAHMAHGDILGVCPTATSQEDSLATATSGNNGNNGKNNGNNGNKGNNGNNGNSGNNGNNGNPKPI